MTYLQFKEVMHQFPVFTINEIDKHFIGFDSRRLVEWQQKGYIERLRNRYYRFKDHQIDEAFLYFTANALYGPSYVSLESALSFYGFIPEGVFQITSCSTLKTNKFDTPVGSFSYRNLKPDLFFGYQLKSWGRYWYAMAGPEKAIIDYIYLHSEISNPSDFEGLRWNTTQIVSQLSVATLDHYVNHIGTKAFKNRINQLKIYLDVNN
jgi:predicted transcriptional regulator of viral defense system